MARAAPKTVSDRFLLDESTPQRVIIQDVTPPEHATKIYAVVIDYGWAETIVAGDCYDHIANDLAWAIGTAMRIPFEIIDVEE